MTTTLLLPEEVHTACRSSMRDESLCSCPVDSFLSSMLTLPSDLRLSVFNGANDELKGIFLILEPISLLCVQKGTQMEKGQLKNEAEIQYNHLNRLAAHALSG